MSSRQHSLEHALGHGQGPETVTGGIEDGVQKRGNDGNHHDSADPFGGSSGVTGGNTSISRSRSGRSDPRATRYCPRFHCPLPGPPSNGGSDSSNAYPTPMAKPPCAWPSTTSGTSARPHSNTL